MGRLDLFGSISRRLLRRRSGGAELSFCRRPQQEAAEQARPCTGRDTRRRLAERSFIFSRAGYAALLLTVLMNANVSAQDHVLRGSVDGSDHHSYRELPFSVPEGVERITVEFDYGGRENKTTIDLGLLGPDGFDGRDGFRGWSGGNKRRFTIGAWDATASYRAGTLTPGTWRLLLGFPNVRRDARAQYTAKIWFDRADEAAAITPDSAARRAGPGWYRGDLHLHSGQSDGTCDTRAGKRGPCPLFLTLQKASEAGLDFVAVTEHNTVSHLQPLRELAQHFDDLLLIPGIEITTFQGHANAFGVMRPIDFRVGSASVPDWNAVLGQVAAQHALVSINHPLVPAGEICMGCRWLPEPEVDYAKLHAVEVVNGADAETPISGIPFWHERLDAGHRLTGIGGSDSHDPGVRVSRLGASRLAAPTTVVYARELSQPAILDGLRSGRVYVDVQETRGRTLDFSARTGGGVAQMGEVLALGDGAQAEFTVTANGVAGGRVEVLVDGAAASLIADPHAAGDRAAWAFVWRGDGRRHWLRVNVRDSEGKLALVGNPIYVDWPQRRETGR